jgi:hypothetical protein
MSLLWRKVSTNTILFVYRISSCRLYQYVEQALAAIKTRYSSDGNLIIIFYAGHGSLDENQNMMWGAERYVLPLQLSL